MNSLKHGTDEQLELYSLGRLDPEDAANLEEHLMICAACEARLERTEEFSLAMRDALQQTPAAEKTASQPLGAGWFGGFGWLSRPSFALAAGIAAILLVSVMFSRSGSRAILPVAAIELSAMRGEMASVHAARELDITLADAPKTAGPFRVEMVNAQGRKIWNGLSAGTPKGIEVKAQVKSIDPGDYFLRLYGLDGELLHEYGLHVNP